jgi:hypothetical protein
MAHGRLAFVLPASSVNAFEAFFNHTVRLKWDTLLRVTYVEGGGTHPYVGAISTNGAALGPAKTKARAAVPVASAITSS